jgi:hypothetical protein
MCARAESAFGEALNPVYNRQNRQGNSFCASIFLYSIRGFYQTGVRIGYVVPKKGRGEGEITLNPGADLICNLSIFVSGLSSGYLTADQIVWLSLACLFAAKIPARKWREVWIVLLQSKVR